MRRLLISARHVHDLHLHSMATYPEECCGILMGRHGKDPDARAQSDRATVERILSAQNVADGNRENRYLIAPKTLLAAHREARSLGLDIVGYYHSHPNHPAEPSKLDRENAWPGVSYVIVAVGDGKVEATRSWRLTDDRLQFNEEVIDQSFSPSTGGGSSPRQERKAS